MPRPRRPPRAGALTEVPPLKIFTQIVILQTAYYACAALLILFTVLVAGAPFSPDLVFSWHSLRGDTTVGWMLGLVWMLNSLILVIFLLILVARSKLVPDFAFTIHILHLIITSLYTRAIPTNWLWWALQIASAALMTSLGVWSCQWRELRPISFGGNSTSRANQPASDPAESASDEAGLGRGRGRGRGRDGAGTYELVGMKEDANGQV
ncbi:MAG: hypothetical protein M4579_005063 [Chaenotheca gracillima]|nr:MAG: hypothetical protein M4579_005063 [Chaenotheca gracillima]